MHIDEKEIELIAEILMTPEVCYDTTIPAKVYAIDQLTDKVLTAIKEKKEKEVTEVVFYLKNHIPSIFFYKIKAIINNDESLEILKDVLQRGDV